MDILAEREGFEPSRTCALRALQARALGHYAISPYLYARMELVWGLRDPNQFHPARSHRVLATFVYPDVLV